jgi:hypothetical protein
MNCSPKSASSLGEQLWQVGWECTNNLRLPTANSLQRPVEVLFRCCKQINGMQYKLNLPKDQSKDDQLITYLE